MEKIVPFPQIPNIPEDDPCRDKEYLELEEESYQREPFLTPGYVYREHQAIPIPRIRKRIGSRLYDTESSECVCTIDGGFLFQKKTRDREWFAVYDDGSVRPLNPCDPLDMLLMETGHTFTDPQPETASTSIRVDRWTHGRIQDAAREKGLSISEFLRQYAETL